eukprot:m.201831 g.201831  ORF g.201831 m.201831 type:complete len:428 (+) comp18805_c0_seq1:294-1577(+)
MRIIRTYILSFLSLLLLHHDEFVSADAVGTASHEQETAVSADGDTMTRVFLNEVSLPPKCIDGSPAAMYIARNKSSTKYIIWLQGGGICENLDDCIQRSKGELGSSKSYDPTRQASRGMLQNNDDNPDFRYWNKIFVPYCSGDVWAGGDAVASNPFPDTSSWTGFFQGHMIVDAVLNTTRDQFGMKDATDIILTGCSAGGIGAFLNCDFVADYAKANNIDAKVRCRPEAGWFGLPMDTYAYFTANSTDPDPRKLQYSNWTAKISPWTLYSPAAQECAAAVRNGSEVIDFCDGQALGPVVCCGLVPVLYKYIKTPMFVTENTADSYQVFTQGGCPRTTSPKTQAFVEYVHDAITHSLVHEVVNGSMAHQNGLFAPACLRHCSLWTEETADIRNVSLATAFGDWYFERNNNSMHINPSMNPATLLACAD